MESMENIMSIARMCRWAALTTGTLFSASIAGYCSGLGQLEMAVAGISILLFLADGLNTAGQ
jgi:hypothetical protein